MAENYHAYFENGTPAKDIGIMLRMRGISTFELKQGSKLIRPYAVIRLEDERNRDSIIEKLQEISSFQELSLE